MNIVYEGRSVNGKTLSRQRRGFGLVEASVTIAMMSAVIGGFAIMLKSTQDAKRMGENRAELQDIGRRTLQKVLTDLRHTGIIRDETVNRSFPAIYERAPDDESGDYETMFATLDYRDVDLVDWIIARDGTGDRIERNRIRESNEVVFALPVIDETTGMLVDPNGNTEWGFENLISYRVAEREDGSRWLERRLNDRLPVIVGPYVSKITFDCIINDRSLYYNQVAVVIYLERVNSMGHTVEVALEGLANLRNTEPLK